MRFRGVEKDLSYNGALFACYRAAAKLALAPEAFA
jgi:hypothetical protein